MSVTVVHGWVKYVLYTTGFYCRLLLVVILGGSSSDIHGLYSVFLYKMGASVLS